MDEVGLGHRLQAARKQAGLTQQELCQKAGLSYSTLAKIERGAIKAPSIFTIIQIAATLGTSLDELIGNAGAQEKTPQKKRSKNGVRFVYFDIDGCLVRFFHRAFTRIADDTGANADVIETTFWHYNDAVCRGEMPLAEFNKILAEQFKVKSIDWGTYYLEAVDPIPEMHQLVRWAAEHYRVGLVSNKMPGLVEQMKQRHLIPGLQYTAIIDSSEVGAVKPEPKIYRIAQEKAGVPPAEILLVDDSRTNLVAAEHEGWHVLWFDDFRPAESVERVRDALEVAE